jgi:small subunit ribosomal protein S14
MKYLNRKDNLRRKSYSKIEVEYVRLKAITFNRKLPKTIRFFFFMQLLRMSKNLTKVRIKNRCIITNRAQSIYRDFKLNRSVIKEFMGSAFLVGIRKSSW